MATTDTITIILATYNRAQFLRRALASLVPQETDGKFAYDILVVDDGSTDLTHATVKEMSHNAFGTSITSVYQENKGHCAALNNGIQVARGNWLAFFDDDQWAEPRWLAELYKTAQETKAACVGGAVCLDLPQSTTQELGPKSRQALGEKLRPPKIKNHILKNILGSGNVMIHKSIFEQIGGFDTSLSRGYDSDFFWRIDKEGFKISFAPQALIHHVINGSRLRLSYLRTICLLKGDASAHIHFKHGGPGRLVIANFWRLGVALGRDLPLITIAGICHDRPLLLDSRCGLWYAEGFIRRSILFLASGLIRS